MSEPGRCQYPVGTEFVTVTTEDARRLCLDEIIYGASFVKASDDDPELYVRVDPRKVAAE